MKYEINFESECDQQENELVCCIKTTRCPKKNAKKKLLFDELVLKY